MILWRNSTYPTPTKNIPIRSTGFNRVAGLTVSGLTNRPKVITPAKVNIIEVITNSGTLFLFNKEVTGMQQSIASTSPIPSM